MADPNVHPRLRGVVGLDTVDLPAAVQLLADIVSSYIPCYDGDEDRAAEWADTDLAAGGVSQLRSDPESLHFRSPVSGLWLRLTPERQMDAGVFALPYASGQTSKTVTVNFAVPFVEPPVVVVPASIYFAAPADKTLTVTLVGLPTATSFTVRGDLSTASTGGTLNIPWKAI